MKKGKKLGPEQSNHFQIKATWRRSSFLRYYYYLVQLPPSTVYQQKDILFRNVLFLFIEVCLIKTFARINDQGLGTLVGQ